MQKFQNHIGKAQCDRLCHQSNRAYHQKWYVQTAFQAAFIYFTETIRNKRATAHAQTYYDRIKKSLEGVCATHSRKGVLAKKSANNKCVGNVIHLLEQISQYHRAWKSKKQAYDTAVCKISFHYRSISILIQFVPLSWQLSSSGWWVPT